MRRGVVLAGGEGTRLVPRRNYNKQLSLVYDRLMIEYPLETLSRMGCEHVTIVSTPGGARDLSDVYGSNYGESDPMQIGLSYAVQQQPEGAAHALGLAEPADKQPSDEPFPVLCGDVYLDPAPEYTGKPTLYWHEFDGAENHTVWNPETNEIIEKPTRDIGKRAIIGYVFDDRLWDIIRELEPSERGELELSDIYKAYLQLGINMVEYDGFFSDMGTPDGLLRVANHVAAKHE